MAAAAPSRAPTWIPGVVLFSLMLAASPAIGQSDAVRTAERLRDAGDFPAAVRVLRAHLVEQPEDGTAARLLAQTLYWAKDVDGARSVYEDALVRHPEDHQLRLDFARLLLETGDWARARTLLWPLREVPAATARASALLGTLSYWEGDLAAAERHFLAALDADPGQEEASRQLREIRLATSPWVRVAPSTWSDDQPLDWGGVELEAGWFATPLTPVRVRALPRWYRLDGRTDTIWLLEGEVRHYAPGLRLETEFAGGILRRTIDDEASNEWTGRAAAGVRLPHDTKVAGRVERLPYLHTLSSLDTSVLVDVASIELHWSDPRGWLAQAALQHQRYPDDNAVRTVYGWILAPMVRRPGLELQAGYAFSADDADESRFVPVEPLGPTVRPGASIVLEGYYDPYYTPERLVKHAVIGAVTGKVSPRATLKIGGTLAIRATEDAPTLVKTAAGIERTFAERSFTPWDVRASIDVPVSDSVTISVAGDAGRGAFYEWAHAGVQISWRLTGAAGLAR